MANEVLNMMGRRKLLTGVGTAIIGGAAANLVARAAACRTGSARGGRADDPALALISGRPTLSAWFNPTLVRQEA